MRERAVASLWLLPAVTVLAATVAAAVLARVGLGQVHDGTGFGGTPDGARTLLSTIAGSIITVTSVTFTLTMVALQVASGQFSPRILQSFLSDRGNHRVLATFLSTFAFSIVTLRAIRDGGGPAGGQPFVPDLAVAVTLGLTALSVAMLVYFIHHITQLLRVESILEELQRETLETIRRHLPERDGADAEPLPDVPEQAATLRASTSGYLEVVDLARMLEVALAHGVVLRLRPRPGGQVTRGSTLAWAWPVAGEPDPAPADLERLRGDVHDALLLGFERTMSQDVAFGIRQMVDIAVRALSPGLNDPATAVATIGALGPVLAELTTRATDHRVLRDAEGRVRLVLDEPSLREYLGLACDQPRRYAASEPSEPTVLVALLEVLGDLAELDGPDPDGIAMQVELTREIARDAGLSAHELDRVVLTADRALATLAGERRTAAEQGEVDEPAG